MPRSKNIYREPKGAPKRTPFDSAALLRILSAKLVRLEKIKCFIQACNHFNKQIGRYFVACIFAGINAFAC